MTIMKNNFRTIITLCIFSSLFACGGGGAGEPDDVVEKPIEVPKDDDAILVSGKVYGLSSQLLTISLNGNETLELNNAGDFNFTTEFLAEQQALVTIVKQPDNMNCQVFNGQTTISDADVTDVIVQCLAAAASCDKTTASSTNPLDLSGNNVVGIEELVADVECGQQQWRIDAQQRINQHRKTSGQITLVDKNGELVSNAKVHLQLQRHDFNFGGVMQAKMWDGLQDNISDLYRQTYLGFNFNKAGLQNGLKYKLRNGFGSTTERALDWLNSYDISVRGHTLIWPGWSHMETNISAADASRMGISAGAPEDLSAEDLKVYVDTIIKDWASKWDVDEWDVTNEPRANFNVQEKLGYDQEAEWFKIAKQHVKNPSATLYLNENRVVSDTATGVLTAKMQTFEDDMNSILNNDGPLEALGFQSRFGTMANGGLLDADTMYQRLSYFDKYNMTIAATEFEMKDDQITSEIDRAIMTERVMSVYFSKENVTDIMVWTFFKSSSSTHNRHIVEPDGSPNLRGKAWLYLVKKHWHTDELTWFDRNSSITFNGFKGEYLATVSIDGFSDETVEFNWLDGNSDLTLRLPNYVNP